MAICRSRQWHRSFVPIQRQDLRHLSALAYSGRILRERSGARYLQGNRRTPRGEGFGSNRSLVAAPLSISRCRTVSQIRKTIPTVKSEILLGAPPTKREAPRAFALIGRPSNQLLIFVQIFAGHVVLRYLVRADFPRPTSVPGVFHAFHYFGLERVSFLEQLLDTLRIRGLDVG